MSDERSYLLFDRELSWLSFSHRVLQEAMDPANAPLKRLEFAAIFSSNLDEFFRVRVASLRALARASGKTLKGLDFDPRALLRAIHETVVKQQSLFGDVLRRRLLPELARQGITLLEEVPENEAQREFARRYFQEEVRQRITPVLLDPAGQLPFLKDRRVYLVAQLWPRGGDAMAAGEAQYGLVEVPSPDLPRFVALPAAGAGREVLYLDDVIRYNLPGLFSSYDIGAVHAIKLSRDAELYLEDELGVDLVEAVRKSLKKRETGLPSRFLYDLSMPPAMLAHVQRCFGLADEDLVRGGRYHNLHDFFSFPHFGRSDLEEEPLPALPHPELEDAPSLLAAVAEKDRTLHVPYQSYDYVIRFLEEAAEDPDVEEIWITLYRVARDSGVVRALIRAAERGKRVTAFVEVKARFDEATNLEWAERMEAAGVRTLYSMPGLKVHAKLALIVRREGLEPRLLAYLSTGNFNEKTARVYADHGLLTADPRLTEDVRRVFGFLAGERKEPKCKHLLVAPFTLRRGLYDHIEAEIRSAEAGNPSGILLKMNSLEDRKIIRRLYEASQAGVPVQLVIRGICCLVPGVPGLSESIAARSIVDRFLEHARVFVFHNGGEEICYLASADWMTRNLSHRVEVAFPLYDPDVRREVREMLDLQLADTAKARVIDAGQRNLYVGDPAHPGLRSQIETYRMLQAGCGAVEQRESTLASA